MTQDEMAVVLRIMLNADNGCPDCARDLMLDFAGRFGCIGLADEVYRHEFGEGLDGDD